MVTQCIGDQCCLDGRAYSPQCLECGAFGLLNTEARQPFASSGNIPAGKAGKRLTESVTSWRLRTDLQKSYRRFPDRKAGQQLRFLFECRLRRHGRKPLGHNTDPRPCAHPLPASYQAP